jgi:hypothetical protein
MRLRPTASVLATVAALSALGCGRTSGQDNGPARADASASVDSGSGPGPSPREDAFVARDAMRADAALPPSPDAASLDDVDSAADAAPAGDQGVDAAAPDATPPPIAFAFAAGAAPLRSARYRLYAVVGPAVAAGPLLTSVRYRLESGLSTVLVALAAEP